MSVNAQLIQIRDTMSFHHANVATVPLKQDSVPGDRCAKSGQTKAISKIQRSPVASRPRRSGQSLSDATTQIPSPIAIDRNSAVPLHKQVCEVYRAAIFRGDLTPGQRIPSSRDLASALCVSRFPVLQAYEQLVAEGYFESRVGAGTFIARFLPSGQGDQSLDRRNVGDNLSSLLKGCEQAPLRGLQS
ncbi:MAG: GntR family transcriptional regulator [Acidobacteriota bacterium]